MKKHFWSIFILSFLWGCTQPTPDGQDIVNQSIAKYGNQNFDKTLTFTFRKKQYSITRAKNQYIYKREWKDDSLGYIQDIVINSTQLIRLANEDTLTMDNDKAKTIVNNVNSVLYFFQIPFILNDKSAIKTYQGSDVIEGEKYDKVQVTFTQKGGGEDYQDVFLYWVHQQNKWIDYLSYQYQTNGGGIRFRKAINRRKVEGLWVQDYINYKPQKEVKLDKLPKLFESHKLIEVSKIINENVQFVEQK